MSDKKIILRKKSDPVDDGGTKDIPKKKVILKKFESPFIEDEEEISGIPTGTIKGKKIIASKRPSVNDYKKYDHRTHVYMKPDNYICSDEPLTKIEWLYNITEKKIYEEEITYFPAWERLYLEILSNAFDNVGKSRRFDVEPYQIEITVTKTRITIKSYGVPMPIEIKEDGKYLPEMAFGHLLVSSNYETERHEAGTNGIGSKAVNIFSTFFQCIVINADSKKRYQQIWRDNMKICEPYKLTTIESDRSSVEISYDMDFARFDMSNDKFYNENSRETWGHIEYSAEYNDTVIALFARHAIDTSFNAKIPVIFNGIKYDFSYIKKYAGLYFGDEAVKNSIVHYQWPTDAVVTVHKNKYQTANVPPLLELLAIDTPDEARHISFANCMMTRDGGVHINAAFKALGDGVVKTVNEKFGETKKGKKTTDSGMKKSNNINISEVKNHISLLVSCRVVNPKFNSQMKTALTAPVPKIKIDEEILKPIFKWKLMDRLQAALEAKQLANLNKSDKEKSGKSSAKFDDANAPKNERSECVLYLMEGDTALEYIQTIIKYTETRRKYIGTLPLKGKILNVRNAGIIQLQAQEELNSIKKGLGLQEGLDYSLDENFKKLRYGALIILTDADVDGKHITGLILNYFACRFPGLLEHNFILNYRTPIVRATKGKMVKKFFTEGEFMLWQRSLSAKSLKSWSIQYFKGLGTSTDDHVKEDMEDPHIVNFINDDNADASLSLAFDEKKSDQRKEWMTNWVPNHELKIEDEEFISTFINEEFIEYSIANIKRSIPKFTDGFKHVQRQIVFGAHKKWNIGPLNHKKYPALIVDRLATFAAEVSDYHHGQISLAKAIVYMARDYTGSNNVPLFDRQGQFGSRYKGSKTMIQTRYPLTNPAPIFPYIFRKEDQPILKYSSVEDINISEENNEDSEGTGEEKKNIKQTEPASYYPIIPLILVNGSTGIGTGWSTDIPNHNMLDVINWFLQRLLIDDTVNNVDMRKLLPGLIPWYRYFTGRIELIDRRTNLLINALKRQQKDSDDPKIEESIEEEDDEDLGIDEQEVEEESDSEVEPKAEPEAKKRKPTVEEIKKSRQLLSMVSYGVFTVNDKGVIIITELPIGLWSNDYKMFLIRLENEKKITKYVSNSVADIVYFEIHGFKETPNYVNLKLKRTIGMSNMVLLDEDDHPVRFDTVYDMLEKFYLWRLPIYEKRKAYMLGKLQEDIDYMKDKVRFIQAVIDKQIKVRNVKKQSVYDIMATMNINKKIYDTTALTNLSQDDIIKLNYQILKKEEEIIDLLNTSVKDIWAMELQQLKDKYSALYPDDHGGRKAKTLRLIKKDDPDYVPPVKKEPSIKVKKSIVLKKNIITQISE